MSKFAEEFEELKSFVFHEIESPEAAPQRLGEIRSRFDALMQLADTLEELERVRFIMNRTKLAQVRESLMGLLESHIARLMNVSLRQAAHT